MGYSPWGRKASDTTKHTCMHTLADAGSPSHSFTPGGTDPVSASIFTWPSSLRLSQSLFSLRIRTQSLN